MSSQVPRENLEPVRGISLWEDAWKRLRRNRPAVVSSVIVLVVVFSALIGPWLVFRYNGFTYETQDLASRVAGPSRAHPIGTDMLGRDLLARVLYVTRVSLMVGLVSTLISLLIGVAYGSIACFWVGRVDEIMMRIVDVLNSLPDILLIVILLALFDRSLLLLFVALGAVSWLTMARIVRGQVLSLKNEQFIEAARSLVKLLWFMVRAFPASPRSILLRRSEKFRTATACCRGRRPSPLQGWMKRMHGTWGFHNARGDTAPHRDISAH